MSVTGPYLRPVTSSPDTDALPDPSHLWEISRLAMALLQNAFDTIAANPVTGMGAVPYRRFMQDKLDAEAWLTNATEGDGLTLDFCCHAMSIGSGVDISAEWVSDQAKRFIRLRKRRNGRKAFIALLTERKATAPPC